MRHLIYINNFVVFAFSVTSRCSACFRLGARSAIDIAFQVHIFLNGSTHPDLFSEMRRIAGIHDTAGAHLVQPA